MNKTNQSFELGHDFSDMQIKFELEIETLNIYYEKIIQMSSTIEKIQSWVSKNTDHVEKTTENNQYIEKLFIKANKEEIKNLDEILQEVQKSKDNLIICGELNIDRGTIALYLNTFEKTAIKIKEQKENTITPTDDVEKNSSNLLSSYQSTGMEKKLKKPYEIAAVFKDSIKSLDELYKFSSIRMDEQKIMLKIKAREASHFYELIKKSIDGYNKISNSSIPTKLDSVKQYVIFVNARCEYYLKKIIKDNERDDSKTI